MAAISTAARQVTEEASLSWWEAAILGLVEGLTEYLPVSSTGHILFVAELLGLQDTTASEDAIETFAICVQVGAILAVLVLYWNRIRSMLDGLLGRDAAGRQVLISVITAFVPTAIIGLAARNVIKDLFEPVPIIAAWIIGGIGILLLTRANWFERGTKELHELTMKHAAIIGVAQAIAMWPGVSRSLVTIVAGIALGLRLSAAVEFSFLLGVITLGAATAFEGLKNGGDMIDTFGWATPLLGLVVGFVSAVVAVRWMVTWLEQRGFGVFGWYRIAVGVLGIVLLAASAI